MPRISGVDIPPDKPIWISLTYLYGIGRTNSAQDSQGMWHRRPGRAKDLSEEELAKIIGIIDRDYQVEVALRRAVTQNVARLRDIQSYRGPGIAGRCRRAGSARGQTPAPARVRAKPWPVRRALRNWASNQRVMRIAMLRT